MLAKPKIKAPEVALGPDFVLNFGAPGRTRTRNPWDTGPVPAPANRVGHLGRQIFGEHSGTPVLGYPGAGSPRSLLPELPQVNLRFYVRRRAEGQWYPGVVFIKQIVPRKLVALVARRAYQEKFIATPVKHWVEAGVDVERVSRLAYH
jgi:hypothetical protein